MRAVVSLLAVALLAGCTSRVDGTPTSDEKPARTVDLAVPIELRPVLESGSTDPDVLVLPAEDGERLTMSDPILTIRRLDGAEVTFEQSGGTWVLSLDLDDADGRVFGDWTAEHTGERLAMVADDEVLMAPQIQSAIRGGEIQIAADYTRDEAEELLARITGE